MSLLMAIVVLVAAYLVGGLPWGLILAQRLRGIDLRQYGSGKIGMTNTARTLGWRLAFVVLALDVLKGVAAVWLARLLTGDATVEALAGLAAIAGHCWSPYIGFGGGRGVASGIGGALALAPWTLLVSLPLGLLVLWLTRYVSLASLLGAVLVAAGLVLGSLLGALPPAYSLFGVVGAALVVGKHHDNIRRLLAGTERKLGEQVATTSSTGEQTRPG